jgi:hypothetical protein
VVRDSTVAAAGTAPSTAGHLVSPGAPVGPTVLPAGPAAALGTSLDEALQLFPQLASAVTTNAASFDQLFEAHYARYERFMPDPRRRSAAALLYPMVRAGFEAARGRIDSEYWCGQLRGGVVLTEERNLEIIYNWEQEDAPVVQILNECDHITVEVRRLGRDEDLLRLLELVYVVYTIGLDALDNRRLRPGVDNKGELDLMRGELEYVKRYHERAAERVAQLLYFRGMLLGLVALVAAVAAVLGGVSLMGISASAAPLALLIASLGAGGVGGLVSVMSRMTFGGLKLNPQSATASLVLLGAFRPVVGAVFAAAVHVLVLGGLIPIAVPSDPPRAAYFVLGLGFIAGFSERWAQDMLASPQQTARPAQPG